ncbi:hypothetical protein N6H14_29000 [Paenibacillus sp. CC-CFT747]|nr:hypothetical protein N6H14_29000 [Paenibacillus sp. CC-CFT747]
MGIGLRYVFRTLKYQFGEEAEIHMESSPGEGTLVTLKLPVKGNKEERHLESSYRG